MHVSNAAISHSHAESQKQNAAVPQVGRLHQTSAAGILPATTDQTPAANNGTATGAFHDGP